MRRSTLFLAVIAVQVVVCASLYVHSRKCQENGQAEQQDRLRLVKELGLTDLCLFTEARYTRHLALADLHSPFQDHPGALEHFPSGALVAPSQLSMRSHGKSH